MLTRGRFLVMAALIVVMLVGLSGFHRVKVTHFKPGPYVVNLTFGSGPNQVGRTVGIDGRSYGPLTFATNGRRTVVADTYRERLLSFGGGHPQAHPLTGEMVEDLALDTSGSTLAVDNRALTVWRIGRHSAKRIMRLPHQTGYSEAIWHVGLAPRGRILVEWVRIGHGTLSTRLDEYTLTGKFVRALSESRVSRDGFQPLTGESLVSPVKDFQVAPDGSIYVEPQQIQTHDRIIRIYREDGLFMGNVMIKSRQKIRRADFLGIDRRGWIYLAVNLDVPHRARLLVVNGQGQTVANVHVSAVPVYAATYGRVLPSGMVYLDQSTKTQYRIQTFRPVTRQIWRWSGF